MAPIGPVFTNIRSNEYDTPPCSQAEFEAPPSSIKGSPPQTIKGIFGCEKMLHSPSCNQLNVRSSMATDSTSASPGPPVINNNKPSMPNGHVEMGTHGTPQLIRTTSVQVQRSRSKKRRTSFSGADRTTKMLVAVLIVFLVCELPSGILGFCSGVFGQDFYDYVYKPLGELLDTLALINSAVNFVLYCAMSSQFRSTFRKLFICQLKETPHPHHHPANPKPSLIRAQANSQSQEGQELEPVAQQHQQQPAAQQQTTTASQKRRPTKWVWSGSKVEIVMVW